MAAPQGSQPHRCRRHILGLQILVEDGQVEITQVERGDLHPCRLKLAAHMGLQFAVV